MTDPNAENNELVLASGVASTGIRSACVLGDAMGAQPFLVLAMIEAICRGAMRGFVEKGDLTAEDAGAWRSRAMAAVENAHAGAMQAMEDADNE